MRDASIENLKLSVTNIRSTLLNSNKQLRRVKIRKKSLIAKFEKQENFRKEESRIESPLGKIGSGISRVAGKITAPAKSFFDRMMDFIKLIGFGILLKNLPRIISAIQNFFSSDFGKGLLKVIKFAGNMLLKVIDLTVTYGPVVINQLKNLMGLIGNQVDEINKINFSNILNNLNPWENYFDGIIKWFSGLSTQSNQSSQNNAPRTGLPPNIPQGANQLSRGGTVRGDTTIEERRDPVYQPRKSGPLKAAQRSADNGFLSFKEGVDNIQDAAMKDERNMMALADMVKTFKSYTLVSSKKVGKRSPIINTDPGMSESASYNAPPSVATGGNIVEYITGDRSWPDRRNYDPGHGGSNYHEHIAFSSIAEKESAISLLQRKGFVITSNYRPGDPGYHGSNRAIDIGFYPSGLTLGYSDDKAGEEKFSQDIRDLLSKNGFYGDGIPQFKNPDPKSHQQVSGVPKSISSLLLLNDEESESVFMLAIQPQEVMIPFPMPIPMKSSNQNVTSPTPKSSALWRV